jgi:hypothetical protein
MADEKNYVGSERWNGDASGIVPLGKIKRSTSLLTPQEQADNEEHDRLIAAARAEAMTK